MTGKLLTTGRRACPCHPAPHSSSQRGLSSLVLSTRHMRGRCLTCLIWAPPSCLFPVRLWTVSGQQQCMDDARFCPAALPLGVFSVFSLTNQADFFSPPRVHFVPQLAQLVVVEVADGPQAFCRISKYFVADLIVLIRCFLWTRAHSNVGDIFLMQ